MAKKQSNKSNTFDHEKKNNALVFFAEFYGNVTSMCEKLDIDRSTYYEWLKDPLFKAEIDKIDVRQLRRDLAFKGLIKHLQGYTTEEIKKTIIGGKVVEKVKTIKHVAPSAKFIELELRKEMGWDKEEKGTEPIINIIVQSDTPNAGD